MTAPPLPPNSDPEACASRYQQDLECCRSRHAGNPGVLELCEQAASRRQQHCLGLKKDLDRRSENMSRSPLTGCNCLDPTNYGCDPNARPDDYYTCTYGCMMECSDQE
ncbi:MAG: hypothetical protein AAF989_13570 [Planctomycetota bacterium]